MSTASPSPRALTPGKVEEYKFGLPNVDHVFLPGHRIMVQVQSSLFPLYDRNPQTFVHEHLQRQAGATIKRATQSIYRAARAPARCGCRSCPSRRKPLLPAAKPCRPRAMTKTPTPAPPADAFATAKTLSEALPYIQHLRPPDDRHQIWRPRHGE